MKHIASCSFGKDSLAMLLLLIEREYPVDEVMFFDNGMEFDAIYKLRDKVKPMLKKCGIGFVELTPDMPFEYKMFDKPVKKRGTNIIHKHGYSWCGGTCRWGTTDKLRVMDTYAKSQNAIVYVGIAADEPKRLEKERAEFKRFPLAEWNMTEEACLDYCYEQGYEWIEPIDDRFAIIPSQEIMCLYDFLKRVSCWCCRNKNLAELKNMYRFFPQYWERLKQMQARLPEPMKGQGKSVFELEVRFKAEIEAELAERKAKGGNVLHG